LHNDNENIEKVGVHIKEAGPDSIAGGQLLYKQTHAVCCTGLPLLFAKPDANMHIIYIAPEATVEQAVGAYEYRAQLYG
jgi:hypothetical protein